MFAVTNHLHNALNNAGVALIPYLSSSNTKYVGFCVEEQYWGLILYKYVLSAVVLPFCVTSHIASVQIATWVQDYIPYSNNIALMEYHSCTEVVDCPYIHSVVRADMFSHYPGPLYKASPITTKTKAWHDLVIWPTVKLILNTSVSSLKQTAV